MHTTTEGKGSVVKVKLNRIMVQWINVQNQWYIYSVYGKRGSIVQIKLNIKRNEILILNGVVMFKTSVSRQQFTIFAHYLRYLEKTILIIEHSGLIDRSIMIQLTRQNK